MNAKWITPAVTAMDSQGHVDMEANCHLYDQLIEQGMDGILLLGSIGEFFAISVEEKRRLMKEAVEAQNFEEAAKLRDEIKELERGDQK